MSKYINYYCSLRIYSDILSGEEIVKTIGLEPTMCWSKGELMRNGKSYYNATGYIIDFYQKSLDVTGNKSGIDEDIENEINLFLEKLLKYKEGLLKITSSERVFITVGSDSVQKHIGFYLNHDILYKLVELSIDIEFDIFPKE